MKNEKICEIVSNGSARNLIQQVTDNPIIELGMCLNIGKLDGIIDNKREELYEYNLLLKYDFNSELNEINKYDHIRIWSSIYDADDYCLLLFLCSKFKDKEISVIYSNEFNNCATTITNLSAEDINDYLNKEHLLKKYEKEDFNNDWIKVLNDNTELRYLLNGNVESVDINYFDEYILNRLDKLGKITLYNLVGDLIVDPPIPKVIFSDWIYMYLIEKLEQENKIKFQIIDNEELIIKN